MKTIDQTTQTIIHSIGEQPKSLGREFTKTFTFETGNLEKPYLTVFVKDIIEGVDALGETVEQSDLHRVQRAVEMAQESREATRADMGYCGDFPIYTPPAQFSWETTKTFAYHTDPKDPSSSVVGKKWADATEGSDRYFETVAEAEEAAQKHMDTATAEALDLTGL